MYCYEFCSIEYLLKNTECECDRSMIHSYFVNGLNRAKSMDNRQDCKRVYLRIYNTLINSMADTINPIILRRECYLYIEKMMPLLSTIFSYAEFNEKRSEVAVLFNYFLKGEKMISRNFNK